MEPRRRLPVLQPASAEPEEDRPPWHWAGFGAVAIFTAWLPLAYVAEAVKARLLRRYAAVGTAEELRSALENLTEGERRRLMVANLALAAVPLLVGAFAGGFLVGRFGGRAGVREAAVAGALTALVVCVLTWLSTGLSWAPLVAFVLLVPAAALGGRVGLRARPGAAVRR